MAAEDVLDDGGLEQVLGFQLRQAPTALYRDYAATLAPVDLTQKQYGVLALIGANPGVSQVALGKALGVDRATMMGVVDRLDARGLLTRVQSQDDRRRQALGLTDAGQRLLTAARALLDVHDARFRSRFSEKELAALMGALKRLRG